MVVTIRTAAPRDAASLAAVAARTFREAFGADNSPEDLDLHCARNFQEEIQLREISDPNWMTFLAEAAGELVGFAQLRLDQSIDCVNGVKPAELKRIYVSDEWHGQGVAQNLMTAALDAAKQAGSDCVWLGVWEHNPKAIAFYRKFGFQVVGEHVFLVGRDAQRDLILVTQLVGTSALS